MSILKIKRHILNPEIDNEITDKNPIIFNKNGKISGTGIYDPKLASIEKRYICPSCGLRATKAGKCKCGEETRKVSSYIKLFCSVTNIYTNYKDIENKKEANVVKSLLEYNSFILNGELVDYTPGTPLTNDEIIYGEDAVRVLFGDKYDNFIAENFYDYLFLVDYKYRKPILGKGGKAINGDLNKLYSDLIKSENDYATIIENFDNDYLRFVVCNKFNEVYRNFLDNFISILYTGKNSIIKKNVISQKIGAAIRGVIVPAPYIEEDYCAVSTIFADTLFPQLKGLWNSAEELNEIISWGHFSLPDYFYDFKNSTGKTKLYPWDEEFSYEEFCEYKNMSIADIKMFIKRYSDPSKPYYCLINRPPSICHLSFMSLKPIFFEDIGRGYYSENFDNPEKIIMEKSSKNEMSACIGINPLICSGMNADFDSDVLFLMSIFGDMNVSCMLPSQNFKTISNGEIRNGIEEMHEQMLEYFYTYDPGKAEIIHNKIEELLNS